MTSDLILRSANGRIRRGESLTSSCRAVALAKAGLLALSSALALLAAPCAQAGGEISPNFRGEDEMHVSFADTGLLAFRAGPVIFNNLSPNWSSPSESFVAPRYSPSFVSFDRSGDGGNSERFAATVSGINAPDATLATIVWANNGTDWATGTNWVDNVAPADATGTDIASFGSGGPVNPNVGAARSINGIIFQIGASAYTIGGSILTIGASGISNSATNTETFSNGIRINNAQSWATGTGGTLTLDGTVDLNANAATSRTTTVTGAGNTTFNGIIQNSFSGSTGNLTYTGSGTLTLANNNTYTGATTLSGGGTTLINGNQATATGAVTVTGTGTILGGTGTIGGAVTLTTAKITGATNGTVGTLTLASNLTVTGTGGYIVDISGINSDKVVIGGTLNLSGGSDTISFSGATDGITSYLLATATSISGTFDNVSSLPSGYSLIYTSSTLVLAPVPEPSTWIGGALALLAIGFTQRKRIRSLIARRA